MLIFLIAKFVLYGQCSLALQVSSEEIGKEDFWIQHRRRKLADHEAIIFFSVPRMSGVIPPPRGVYRVLVRKT
jgi:hypothetical protein